MFRSPDNFSTIAFGSATSFSRIISLLMMHVIIQVKPSRYSYMVEAKVNKS